jgi:hypothetical protein
VFSDKSWGRQRHLRPLFQHISGTCTVEHVGTIGYGKTF